MKSRTLGSHKQKQIAAALTVFFFALSTARADRTKAVTDAVKSKSQASDAKRDAQRAMGKAPAGAHQGKSTRIDGAQKAAPVGSKAKTGNTGLDTEGFKAPRAGAVPPPPPPVGGKSHANPEEADTIKSVSPKAGRATVKDTSLTKDEKTRAQEIESMRFADTLKNADGDKTNIRSLFGEENNYSSREEVVRKQLARLDRLATSDLDKGKLRAVVGEYMTRIDRLPDSEKQAAIAQFEAFVSKIEEALKSAKTDSAKQELYDFMIGAIARSGAHPKPGEKDPKARVGLAAATSKLEAYGKDPEAFAGLAGYYGAFGKAYHAAINKQLAANPKHGRQDINYYQAALDAAKDTSLWTRNRLEENGVAKDQIKPTEERLCKCTDSCKI